MYPVAFEADFVERRSRLSSFFRGLISIPWMIVAVFWGLAALVCSVIAWFAIVATGRYPDGLYNVVAQASRYIARVNAFQHLMTDELPPFDGGEHPEYPIRLVIAAPAAHYSRAKTFFRGILMIPVMIVLYLMLLLARTIAVLSWFTILAIGRQPAGLFGVTKTAIAYQARAQTFELLLTEEFPPLSADDNGSSAQSSPGFAAAG
jgi:ABC-type sugar transport system permease subunit